MARVGRAWRACSEAAEKGARNSRKLFSRFITSRWEHEKEMTEIYRRLNMNETTQVAMHGQELMIEKDDVMLTRDSRGVWGILKNEYVPFCGVGATAEDSAEDLLREFDSNIEKMKAFRDTVKRLLESGELGRMASEMQE